MLLLHFSPPPLTLSATPSARFSVSPAAFDLQGSAGLLLSEITLLHFFEGYPLHFFFFPRAGPPAPSGLLTLSASRRPESCRCFIIFHYLS